MPYKDKERQKQAKAEWARKQRLHDSVVYLHLPRCNRTTLTHVADELEKAMKAGFFTNLDMRISLSNYKSEEAKPE